MQGLLADLSEAQAKLRQRADCNPAVIEYADALAKLEALISVRPRVVVLGETNAGKTSLTNLLLDQTIVPQSVIANTRRPLVLRYGETARLTGITRNGRIDLTVGDAGQHDISNLRSLEACIPNPRLSIFDLVDTPGLSTSEQLHDVELQATDLVLWCTPATQAWKESERRLWMSIPRRHHRDAILIATHRDHLRDDHEMRKVRARLAAETAGCFQSIVLVCASTRGEDRTEQRQDSGAAELDNQIEESLRAIAQRRHAVGYRLANCIVRKALTCIERPSAALQVDGRVMRRFTGRVASTR
jgi:tRNA U34 5-carboxymethylaminomethyl modifying GTPase MnmE/TrmE